MKRILFGCIVLSLATTSASAAWKVETGRKVMSMREDPVGRIATLLAKNASHSSTARLQIECFVHPQLHGISLGIVLSKPTAPGALGWRYSFDGAVDAKEGPYSRTSLTVVALSDARGAMFKGIRRAKMLKLTLLPASGPQLQYEFDVSGAQGAIERLSCH
jgi:hypothetical protein